MSEGPKVRRRRRRRRAESESSGLAAQPESVEACEGESEAPSEQTESTPQWESTESDESSEDRPVRLGDLEEAAGRLEDVEGEIDEATARVLEMADVAGADARIRISVDKSRSSSSATEADARIRAIDDGLTARGGPETGSVRRSSRKVGSAMRQAFRMSILFGPPRAFDGQLYPRQPAPPRPKR